MIIKSLENIEIKYLIKTSWRAKNLRLTITNRWLSITAPTYFPKKEIVLFVESKIDWIKKHLDNLTWNETRLIWEGTEIKIFWDDHILKIKKTLINKSYVVTVWSELKLYVWLNNKSKNHIKDTLEEYFRDLAKKYLEKRSKYFANKLWVEYNNILIKDQKTRWWSCSSMWNINYNYRIIFAPLNVIDYLVVHELCHLEVMWHTKKFWDLVGTIIPSYKEDRKWLKKNWDRLVI